MDVDPDIERDIEAAREASRRLAGTVFIAIGCVFAMVVIAVVAFGVWLSIRFNT